MEKEAQFEMNVLLRTQNVDLKSIATAKWQMAGMREVDECMCSVVGATKSQKSIYHPHYSQLIKAYNNRVTPFTSHVVAALSFERDVILSRENKNNFIFAHNDVKVDAKAGVDPRKIVMINEWFNHGSYIPLSPEQYIDFFTRADKVLTQRQADDKVEAVITPCVLNLDKAAAAITATQPIFEVENVRYERVNNHFECTVRVAVRVTRVDEVDDFNLIQVPTGPMYKIVRSCAADKNPLVMVFSQYANDIVEELSHKKTIRQMISHRIDTVHTPKAGAAEDKNKKGKMPARVLQTLAKQTQNKDKLMEIWAEHDNENAINIKGNKRYDTAKYADVLNKLPKEVTFLSGLFNYDNLASVKAKEVSQKANDGVKKAKNVTKDVKGKKAGIKAGKKF